MLKVPAIFLFLMVVGRAIGVGVMTPVFAILQASWLIIRTVVDLLTSNSSPSDGWFWAFLLVLCWPIYSAYSFLFASRPSKIEEHKPQAPAEVLRPLSRASSQRSIATTHTASDSIVSTTSITQCDADGVYLRKNKGQPLNRVSCKEAGAQWQRLHLIDGRDPDRGKKNLYDGRDWILLRTTHQNEYADWILSLRCDVPHCDRDSDADSTTGKASLFCSQHAQRESEREEVRPPPFASQEG